MREEERKGERKKKEKKKFANGFVMSSWNIYPPALEGVNWANL